MTKENKRSAEKLPFETIAAAAQGDTDALGTILKYYEGYIAKLSTRIVHDEYGNSFPYVDEELRNRLKIRLIARTLMFNATI